MQAKIGMEATCAGSAAASEGEAALSAGAAAFLAASSMALVWASTSLARSFVLFSMPSPSTNLHMRAIVISQRRNTTVKCCECIDALFWHAKAGVP